MREYSGTSSGISYRIEAPESLIFINSRHVYLRVRLTEEVSGEPISGVKIQSVLQVGAVQDTNEYRYTDADGRAVFDYAALLRMMTDNADKEMSNLDYGGTSFAAWQTAVVSMSLYIQGRRFFNARSQYFNGAHDIRHDWWKDRRRLKYWLNYPFTFDFPNQQGVIIQMPNGASKPIEVPSVNTDITALVRFNPESANITSDSTIITTDIGVAIVDGVTMGVENRVTLQVDRCQQSDDRCYLRWLGDHGEVFYWLFFKTEEHKKVDTETYHRAMVDDVFRGVNSNRLLDNGIIRDSEIVKTVDLYSEYMDREYYDYVSQIGSSPFVDMYMGGDKWQRVNVSDATYSQDMRGSDRAKKHRVSLTIEIGG